MAYGDTSGTVYVRITSPATATDSTIQQYVKYPVAITGTDPIYFEAPLDQAAVAVDKIVQTSPARNTTRHKPQQQRRQEVSLVLSTTST
jgi:hypothetical protein